MITLNEIQKAVPATLKNSVNQNLVDNLNNISNDPIIAESIRENFLTYTSILKEGRFKAQDYMNAITYVTYKIMGYTNMDAYCKTFPQRHADLVARGVSNKDIASYVSAYHKGKMITLILEQSMIPVWLLNQETYQRAINVQAELMLNAKSEKVRSDAANSILTHLAKPKDSSTILKLDTNDAASGLNELKDTLSKLADAQLQQINSGVSPKQIAESRIIEAEVIDNE